jgi:hypothetical protein
MAVDPTSIITQEDMRFARTPDELVRWVEQKCHEFSAPDKAVKQYALLHVGLSKQFYEEVRPLSLLVTKLYSGRADVLWIPTLDSSKDFDAVIYDGSVLPPAEIKVEITLALNKETGRNKHLRMEYFLEHGHVNLLGEVTSTGTRQTRRKITVAENAYKHTELLQRTFSLVRWAAARKCAPGRYGHTHILVIFVDDWLWFDKDAEALAAFMEMEVLTLPLNFRVVYVVGASGKTFLPFNLTRAEDKYNRRWPTSTWGS